jgi:hypothetical protein
LARNQRKGGPGSAVAMRHQVIEGIRVAGSPEGEAERQGEKQPSHRVAALPQGHDEADRRSTRRRAAVDDHL